MSFAAGAPVGAGVEVSNRFEADDRDGIGGGGGGEIPHEGPGGERQERQVPGRERPRGSHAAPHVTVIDAKDGSIVGTIDLGGMPEQAVTDGKGHLYIDLEDKDKIAVVDAKTMMLTTTYDLAGKGGTCAALAFDVKNHILFAGCRNPANMVILNSDDGKIITTIPIGVGTDGAVFNPNTMEAFTSQGDGTLSVVKENSPTSFALEQTVQTMVSAKTLTLDAKTGHILLIAAEYGPPPATPPAGTPPGRPARGPMVPGSFSVLMVGVGK